MMGVGGEVRLRRWVAEGSEPAGPGSAGAPCLEALRAKCGGRGAQADGGPPSGEVCAVPLQNGPFLC